MFIDARADGSVTVVIQKLVASMPDSRSVLAPGVMFVAVVVVAVVVAVAVAVVFFAVVVGVLLLLLLSFFLATT